MKFQDFPLWLSSNKPNQYPWGFGFDLGFGCSPEKDKRQKKKKKKKKKRIQHCHCCGSGVIPGLGTFACHGRSQKNLFLIQALMKETEDDTKKWKYLLCSQIGRINIVKILPKAIYIFNAIPTKIPMNSKIFMEPQKTPPNSQNNLEKKE